jgi:hypothetical protein
MNMKKLNLWITILALIIGFGQPTKADAVPINYDEASDGDLAGWPFEPDLGAADIGLNVVTGSIYGMPGTYDGNDAFDFEIPIGLEAVSITLTVENFNFLTSPAGVEGDASNSEGVGGLDKDTYTIPYDVEHNFTGDGTFSFGTPYEGTHMINTYGGFFWFGRI